MRSGCEWGREWGVCEWDREWGVCVSGVENEEG